MDSIDFYHESPSNLTTMLITVQERLADCGIDHRKCPCEGYQRGLTQKMSAKRMVRVRRGVRGWFDAGLISGLQR